MRSSVGTLRALFYDRERSFGVAGKRPTAASDDVLRDVLHGLVDELSDAVNQLDESQPWRHGCAEIRHEMSRSLAALSEQRPQPGSPG